ncbi:MAG: hypothetical protein HLUCCA01_06740 [Bacteroidetes bacterium HLUCCA01]|nr:MAG: hypothetical protein HLUCCA01_06740 [Bacteroidetes bacterium HLUCCA01]
MSACPLLAVSLPVRNRLKGRWAPGCDIITNQFKGRLKGKITSPETGLDNLALLVHCIPVEGTDFNHDLSNFTRHIPKKPLTFVH